MLRRQWDFIVFSLACFESPIKIRAIAGAGSYNLLVVGTPVPLKGQKIGQGTSLVITEADACPRVRQLLLIARIRSSGHFRQGLIAKGYCTWFTAYHWEDL
jgi:hypothetical protein